MLSSPGHELALEALAGSDFFTDAVVTATRTVEHTHQAEKIEALRNAVLNSAAPGAPDADTQAIILNLIASRHRTCAWSRSGTIRPAYPHPNW